MPDKGVSIPDIRDDECARRLMQRAELLCLVGLDHGHRVPPSSSDGSPSVARLKAFPPAESVSRPNPLSLETLFGPPVTSSVMIGAITSSLRRLECAASPPERARDRHG